MCPINSQNEEKLAQYVVSLAHGRGGSQDEVKLAPPSPMRAVARRTRRKIYYSLRLLLVPTTLVIEIISYCLEYICPLVDFNMNYQYILQTLMYIDVFQSVDSLILLRMQHSPSPLDPRPRGGRAAIHSVSYSQNDIYCTTIIARLPKEAKSQSQG